MALVNLATDTRLDAMFNPAELQEEIEAKYNDLAMLGMSHEPEQYSNTTSLKLDFELFLRASTPGDLEYLNLFKNFLYSLTVPRVGAGNVRDGAPPRVLLVWPSYLSMTCRIRKLSSTASRFNIRGMPVVWTIRVETKESRDVRIGSDEVLDVGMQRASVGRR